MSAQGVDPLAYMRQVAARLNQTEDADALNRMLDDLEYLYEVLDPELQYLADDLVQRLRDRLKSVAKVR